MARCFLISLVFLHVMSRLSGPDKVEERKPPLAILANFRAVQSHKKRDRRLRRMSIKFPFTSLPEELQLAVLSHASNQTARRLFLALVLVCKDIRQKTLIECLPLMAVTLTTRQQILAFDGFCFNNPELARLVRRLWISPTEEEARFPSHRILKNCTGVASLACNAQLLDTAICSGTDLEHRQCRFLTLLKSPKSWEGLLSTRTGAAFFNQLTHLHTVSAMVPKKLQCSSLTHLSIMWDRGTEERGAEVLSSVINSERRYPRLGSIVITQRRDGGERAEIRLGGKSRPRVVAYFAGKGAIDATLWREGIDVWERAEALLTGGVS
jgi:hypothetical protein